MDPIGTALSGLLGGLVIVVVGFLVAYFNNQTQLTKRVGELTTQVFSLQDSNLNCVKREGELKAEVTAQAVRIRNLESATGTIPPALLAGIIVADTQGKMREYSPALTAILQYLPREVVGKMVDLLVPADVWQADGWGFRAACLDPAAADPGREFLSYATTKAGERVPVAITLHGWREDKSGFVTLTIRQRVRGPSPAGSNASDSDKVQTIRPPEGKT